MPRRTEANMMPGVVLGRLIHLLRVMMMMKESKDGVLVPRSRLGDDRAVCIGCGRGMSPYGAFMSHVLSELRCLPKEGRSESVKPPAAHKHCWGLPLTTHGPTAHRSKERETYRQNRRESICVGLLVTML